MISFKNEQEEKLKMLLKQNQQDFRFDEQSVRLKLLQAINRTKPAESQTRFFHMTRTIKFASATAVIVIFISTTFAFAANSKPGDKLFALNKFGEKFLLKLPLSAEQKATIQTNFVTKRLEDLEAVQIASSTHKQLETVKESDESLKEAVEAVSTNRNKLETEGRTESVKKLNRVLNQLNDLAARHEKQIEALETSTTEESVKQVFDLHLNQIKDSRHRVRLELKLEDEKD